MKPLRNVFALFLALGIVACNRSQPPGVPDTAGSPPPPQPARQVEPAQTAKAPPRELAPPPPLDSEIPPYDKTGFPDCDNYIEEYRQCLNSRLGGEERKAAAQDLRNSVIAITGNISRNVEPSRIASRCKKSRRIAAAKLERYGCIMQAP